MSVKKNIGVIVQLYYLSKEEEQMERDFEIDLCPAMNVSYLFYASIFVFLLHRIVSSLLLYQVSQGNKLLTFLQIFDLSFVKSLEISYRFGSTEPPSPQVYLSNIEAMFERFVLIVSSFCFVCCILIVCSYNYHNYIIFVFLSCSLSKTVFHNF